MTHNSLHAMGEKCWMGKNNHKCFFMLLDKKNKGQVYDDDPVLTKWKFLFGKELFVPSDIIEADFILSNKHISTKDGTKHIKNPAPASKHRKSLQLGTC